MRGYATIISVMMAVLVTVVTGCGGAARYDGRLSAADSLMRSAPDSALAIVQAVDRDSLATAADRAYHDLLLTQARYRCYVTATSDSDINRAVDYYLAHSGEREKLTRALLYKGAVMEELGHPDSAMIYYKHAESTAAPDDYFNLGYTKMRIATLYQDEFSQDSNAIIRLKDAIRCFEIVKDTNYLISCYGHLGAICGLVYPDSTKAYLNEAINLAIQTNSPKQYTYKSKLAGFYFYHDQDYRAAKELAMDVFRNGRQYSRETQFYYYAIWSYLKVGQPDSAKLVFEATPPPCDQVDSMNMYQTFAEFAKAENNLPNYSENIVKSHKSGISYITDKQEDKVKAAEFEYDKIDAEKTNTQYRKNVLGKILGTAALFILTMILILWQVYKRFKKKVSEYQQDINLSRAELEKTINLYEDRIAKSESSLARQQEALVKKDKMIKTVTKERDRLLSQQRLTESQVAKIVRNRLAAINELYQEIRVKTSNEAPYKRTLPLISIIKELNDKKKLSIITPKDSFWKKLKSSIDDEYQGLATFVEKKYPHLTKRELQLFWLLCAKISPQIIKLCMNFTNYTTVSNYKRKLIKDIMGHDMKFEEFIQAYIDGKLD